jgi:glycolate oxidase FAD binding subunit
MGVSQAGLASVGAFADEVGVDGPVCVVGGRTQWHVGGEPKAGTQELRAPDGVVSHQPAEMIVRVLAGTRVADLGHVLAAAGQMVPLDPDAPDRATVGGVLAVGQSGPRRLRYGPVRDAVLEVRFVSATGRVVKAGGPVVKNVTGYDLCRLMVGSLGTLGLLAEVVLRCYPLPTASRWFRSVLSLRDPREVAGRIYRASSVLWDGERTWVWLEGHPADVAAQAEEVLGSAFEEVTRPPVMTYRHRLSLPPAVFGRLVEGELSAPGPWLAEVGVGTVHTDRPAEVAAAVGIGWPPRLEARVAALHQELKARFDPTGRLNPGRQVAVAVPA